MSILNETIENRKGLYRGRFQVLRDNDNGTYTIQIFLHQISIDNTTKIVKCVERILKERKLRIRSSKFLKTPFAQPPKIERDEFEYDWKKE